MKDERHRRDEEGTRRRDFLKLLAFSCVSAVAGQGLRPKKVENGGVPVIPTRPLRPEDLAPDEGLAG